MSRNALLQHVQPNLDMLQAKNDQFFLLIRIYDTTQSPFLDVCVIARPPPDGAALELLLKVQSFSAQS